MEISTVATTASSPSILPPVAADPNLRIQQVRDLFGRHPGTTEAARDDATGDVRIGNGGDMVAFMSWLRDSGRFANPWWDKMDVGLVQDALVGEQLVSGRGAPAKPSEAQRAWSRYMLMADAVAAKPSELGEAAAERAFWRAHSMSLIDAQRALEPLAAEQARTMPREMAFGRGMTLAGVGLEISGFPADKGGVAGTLARALYPASYPVDTARLNPIQDAFVGALITVGRVSPF